MSVHGLLQLQAGHAFDPAPRHGELYALHVPFDDLTGGGGCEQVLGAALSRGERVAVVGSSGCGKSSVISHVLNPLVEGLAPLPVPVAIEDPQVATSAVAFAAHLVRTVARYVEYALPQAGVDAEAVALRTSREIAPPRRTRSSRLSVAPSWMGARVELAAELRSASERWPVERPGQEIIDEAQAILDVVTAHGLRPVVVLDDTDKWLQLPGLPDPGELMTAFFAQVPRLLSEQLATATVIAVHENYLGQPGYQASAGFLESTVRVPAVPDHAGLARILSRRAAAHLDEEFTELMTEPALEALMEHYAAGATADLRRRVLFVAHTALTRACDEGADLIAFRHVELAINECAPEERADPSADPRADPSVDPRVDGARQ